MGAFFILCIQEAVALYKNTQSLECFFIFLHRKQIGTKTLNVEVVFSYSCIIYLLICLFVYVFRDRFSYSTSQSGVMFESRVP